MPKRSSKPKGKRVIQDPNLQAVRVLLATTEPGQVQQPVKNPAAVALGRLGGLKGGKARTAKLSARKRKEIARKAAKARWGKTKA